MNLHPPRSLAALLLTAALAAPATAAGPTSGRTLTVGPQGRFTSLSFALASARDGDTVSVPGGVTSGPVVIDKRVRVIGTGWPVIDGKGRGTVVKIVAAGAVLRGFVIRDSGSSLDDENSGVAVEASGVVVAGNRLEGTLFGVYAKKADGSTIQGNLIRGKDLDVPRRGDAIRVWYSQGVRVVGNDVEGSRDVVLWYSNHLTVARNRVRAGRYGLHFMYCDDAEIRENRLVDDSVGAFLMYSRRLHLDHNVIARNRGPSGYGIGLKDMDGAVIEDNLFLDNRVGAYVDDSPREVDSTLIVRGNVFAGNDTGVRLLPLVRHDSYLDNAFVDNQVQVGLTGEGRLVDDTWSGNYWSDYAGFDRDGDGRGDVPYRAERLFESLMDRDPDLRLFLYSPASEAVDLAAKAFPIVRPRPKLVDPSPRMAMDPPRGLPLEAPSGGRRLLGTSCGLIVLAGLLVAFPLLTPRSVRAACLAKATPAADAASGGCPLVQVTGLTKAFGRLRAVDDLSFAVRPGEAVALWGANGAGKTTAIRCLLGVLPCAGSLAIGGHDVRRQGREARRLVGFVPQEVAFHDEPTVRETLRFYARLKRTSPAPIPSLLGRLGLEEHAGKRVGELSGGLRQRLALAVALLAAPPLLVLDEPTANLDAAARGGLLSLLSEVKAAGKALVFTSHRLDEVTGLADRVLVLDRGHLEAEVPPADLIDHLGLSSTLHLLVPEGEVSRAAGVLESHGYEPHVRGAALSVATHPREKGRPIALLVQAGLHLEDFELDLTRREGGGRSRA